MFCHSRPICSLLRRSVRVATWAFASSAAVVADPFESVRRVADHVRCATMSGIDSTSIDLMGDANGERNGERMVGRRPIYPICVP